MRLRYINSFHISFYVVLGLNGLRKLNFLELKDGNGKDVTCSFIKQESDNGRFELFEELNTGPVSFLSERGG